MKCKSCPMYVIDVDPEGITMRLCRWDGHQVYDNMECDAHFIKLKAFCEVKEEMRKETHNMDSEFKYKAFINGEWHDLTLSDSPNELTEWLKSNEEWARVKHGHWIIKRWISTIFCSECRNSWSIMDNDTETFNYCPNCGAKMDEVTDEAGKC